MPDQPRSPAAIRQARCRRRARLGLVPITIDLPSDRLADYLIDRGVITEDESADQRVVAAALALLVRRLIGA